MSFIANFIRFPAVQKFWKSVKIWQSYREFKGGNFFWDSVERCSMSTYTGVTNCQKQSGFLAHPVYAAKFDFEMSKEYAGDSRNDRL